MNNLVNITKFGEVDGGSIPSQTIWRSPSMEYTYDDVTHTGELGNYWSGYGGTDEDPVDGIGDTSYHISDELGDDDAPLMTSYKIYLGGGTLSYITVTPSTAELVFDDQQTFTATGYDGVGDKVPDLTFEWTMEGDAVGTIDQNGVFTAADATGSATIKATSGLVSGTAEVTVREPAAELTPVSIASSDTTPDSTHTYEVTVAGTNTGELATDAFNVTLFENGIGIANNSVENVAPDGDFSTVFTWKPSVAGAVNLTAVLDSGGAVTEIDEFNNNISVEYNVAAPDPKVSFFFMGTSSMNAILHYPDNWYYITITNAYTGADTGPFNISVWNSYTNETEIVQVDSLSCGHGEDARIELNVTIGFTPDTGESFNATVTIDPENLVPEEDEANNVVNKTVTVIKNGYAGYRINGDDDIQTLRVWDINGSVTMSKGNSWYMTMGQEYNKFENSVTWQKGSLDIPENATVVEARLMLPYTWDYGGDFGNGFKEFTAPDHVNVTFNGVDKIYDRFYTDRNGWSAYDIPYGQIVYNVTGEFNETDKNYAFLELEPESEYFCPRGMILMVVYEDKSLPRRQMFYAEGFDLLIGEAQYFTTPEMATGYATFTGPDINLKEMTSATLIAMSTGSNGYGPNDDRINELLFNNLTVKNGMGTPLGTSEIAIATVDVTDYVKVNGNEAGGRDYADYIEPMNFILIASYGEVKNENTYVNVAAETSDDPLWAGTDRGRLSYKDDTPAGEIKTSEEGKTLTDFSVPSGDGKVSADIPKGTLALDKDGAPVDEIEIGGIDSVDVDGYDEGTFSFAGAAYECSPSGATFSPAIDLVFTFTADEWKQFDGTTPSVMYYNTKTKDWEEVETTYDPDTMTVTASITHFSKYAVFAKTSGAAVTSAATEEPVHSEMPEVTGDQDSGSGNEGSSPASNAILGLFAVGFVGICSFGAYKFKLSRNGKELFREK